MPIIWTFFGIVIRMFYKEHEPPHFHAEYQGQQAKYDFGGEIIAGYIRSGTARALIQRWAVAHGGELEANREIWVNERHCLLTYLRCCLELSAECQWNAPL